MKYAICSLLIVILLQLTAPAFGGSVFSSRGFGQPALLANARSLGMGGVAIALSGPLTISRLNPAGLSGIRTTALTLQYLFENNRYEDGSGSNISSYSNIDGFHFVLPLGRGAGLAAGLTPLTRIDYYLTFDEQLGGEPYTKSVEGSGGLNTFTFSAFWAVRPFLALGLSGHYVFGKMVESWEIDYENSAFYQSTDTYSTKNWGYGFTAGLLIKPLASLQIGAVYSTDYHIDNRTDIYYVFTTDNKQLNGSLLYPSSWGIGLTYQVPDLVLIGGDFQYYMWNHLQINGNDPGYTDNQIRIAAGAEFFHSRQREAPYIKRLAYRVGFSYQPYFALDASGQTVNEYWGTLGFGFPLISNTRLDIALGYGIRGSVDMHQLRDNLFRVSASITGGERWFVRKC